MWVAAKGVLLPFFRDPHRHPALAAEYLVEYQTGPFTGLNQLGLPGPLSKISAMYRHPLGDLELSGAATVLLDHISRAGTLQIGAHAGYRVPFGEHLWIFGQAILQMPSWGRCCLMRNQSTRLTYLPCRGHAGNRSATARRLWLRRWPDADAHQVGSGNPRRSAVPPAELRGRPAHQAAIPAEAKARTSAEA